MSRQTPSVIQVYCGELCKSNDCSPSVLNLLHKGVNDISANIEINYARFVNDPELIPQRIVDLLQIAVYVFSADRMAFRGERDSVENGTWARSFEFNIPVYDLEFWNAEKTKRALCTALQFMTGDRKYSFAFHPLSDDVLAIGDKQLRFEMFSNEYETIEEAQSTDIILFSGGLDSLAGSVRHLNEFSDRNVCLVSHQAHTVVMNTQSSIVKYLKEKYGTRVRAYGFKCHNRTMISKEETQRTRMFLFSAIAFALCNCYEKHDFYVYENGITSMNLAKQVDTINARASRTTHPKTLGLLSSFYRLFDESFKIITPYYNKTKAEIVEVFKTYSDQNIITSAVSCSTTRKKQHQGLHCGVCSQCIDRRFAIAASSLNDDYTVYSNDFVREFKDRETAQRVMNTLRLASMDEIKTQYDFLRKYPTEIGDLVEYWPGANPDDRFEEIYTLVRAYCSSILRAATELRNKYDDINIPVENNSLLGLINKRDYLKTPFEIKVNEIDDYFQNAIPTMFQHDKPKHENDFNDKVSAILNSHEKFSREYPSILFGATTLKPDHSQEYLLIESKYVRGKSMTLNKASEDIAADIFKSPDNCCLLFVIYDPERKIIKDDEFIQSFEDKRSNCFVRIYR